MHGSVPKILPCVEDADCRSELKSRDEDPINELGDIQLPFCKGRRRHFQAVVQHNLLEQLRIRAASQRSGPAGMIGHRLGKTESIYADQSQQPRNSPLRPSDALRPERDIVLFPANHFFVIKVCQDNPGERLNDLLDDHVTKHFKARCMVSLEKFGGCMQAVLGEEVIDVDKVEEQTCNPVSNDGQR